MYAVPPQLCNSLFLRTFPECDPDLVGRTGGKGAPRRRGECNDSFAQMPTQTVGLPPLHTSVEYRNSTGVAGFVKVSQWVCKRFFLRNLCATIRDELCITEQGTQRKINKGVQGVVFTATWWSGLCFSSVVGVRRRLALSAVAPRLTPPTTRLLSSWLCRSTLAFHSSGGLTAVDRAPMQFPPLTLPCIGAWVIGSASARGFF